MKQQAINPYPTVSRSLELYQQAGEVIPGWTQLISRRADQFANGVSPIYAQRAKGARFVDENEYIGCWRVMSYAPYILRITSNGIIQNDSTDMQTRRLHCKGFLNADTEKRG